MKNRIVLLTAAVLVAALAVCSGQQSSAGQQAPQQPQQPQQPSTPAPGPGTSPGQQPSPFPGNRDTRTPQQPTWNDQRDMNRMPEMQRPIFLSGKVVMDDGTPPPEPVVIERVCNGNPRPEAYTDSKGRFSFQLGQNMQMMPDASVSSQADVGGFGGNQQRMPGMMSGSGISERDLMGCELRASLAGYRSEVIPLAGRRVMDNPEVGTILLKRLGNVEGFTISATSALAPKDARKSFDKARESFKKQKWADAKKELEKAVGLYPKYAAAWHQLGLVNEKQENIEAARKAYSQALAADAKFINPYLQLAQLSARQGQWQDVADTTSRIMKLNPFDFPQAFFFNAVANYNLHNLDAAESSARETVKLDTAHRFAKANHLLGVILAQKNDYTGAAEQMENYLKFAPQAKDADQVRKQLDEIRRFAPPAAQQQ